MNRFQFLRLTAVILTCACALSPVLAQTGPAVADPGATPSLKRMTAERLADLLRQDGNQVEVKGLINKGKKVITTVLQDGWRFVVEFEFTNPNNLNIICPLGNPASQFPAAQLQALLQKSYDLPCPLHFSYRAADQRLCLEDPCYSTANLTDAAPRAILDRLLKVARQTHPVWDSSRWQQGVAAPVVSVGPTALARPAPAPVAPGLANTTWVGRETLQGYGPLEFRFGPDGTVSMIDRDGAHAGRYTAAGPAVILHFYGGSVVYSGTLSGQTLNGTAQNSKGGTWNFSVRQ